MESLNKFISKDIIDYVVMNYLNKEKYDNVMSELIESFDNMDILCCVCKTVYPKLHCEECEECKNLYCYDCASKLLMFNDNNSGDFVYWDGNQFLFCGCHFNPDPNENFKKEKKI